MKNSNSTYQEEYERGRQIGYNTTPIIDELISVDVTKASAFEVGLAAGKNERHFENFLKKNG